MSDLVLTISRRRAVIFDFDDTLVATLSKRKPLFWRFIQLIADPPSSALDEVWGRPMHEMLSRLAPDIDETRILEAYAAIMELNPPVPLLPGAESVVRCLSENGIPLLILTSSARRLVESDLSRHNLLQFFQLIWSSDEIPWAKPDARVISPLLEWLSERGLALAETILIGDSLTDLELSRRAGIPFLAVTSGVTDRAAFLSAGCSDIIDSLEVIAGALCGGAQVPK